MTIKVLYKIPEDGFVPTYETAGASGMDIRAFIPDRKDIVVGAGKTALVTTGVRVQIPVGFEIQVRSRSGLAAKSNVFVLNSPGTIDSDYTGEIKVILHNLGNAPYTVRHGDRIAQLILTPVYKANMTETTEFVATQRGEGGFGSTGKS